MEQNSLQMKTSPGTHYLNLVAILNILAVLSFRFCLRSRILFSLRHYGWFCVLNFDVVSGISPGPQVPRLQGLRQHTQGATASLPPTTASAGLTSTCLPASCWTWPSLCPLRVCLSFRCGCPYTFLHTECLKCILVQGSNISCWNVAVSFVYTKLTSAVQSVQVDSQDCV